MHHRRSSGAPVENGTACAAVHAFGQCLYFDDPALRAHLGSSSRIDPHKLDGSVCSFVLEHCGHSRPRAIEGVLGQFTAGIAARVTCGSF